MQVLGWCDAGPRMVLCRSSDGVIQVLGWCDAGPGCAKVGDGNCRDQMVDFFGMEMFSAEYMGNNLACHKFSFLSGPSL